MAYDSAGRQRRRSLLRDQIVETECTRSVLRSQYVLLAEGSG
jgi:hypothetical protein